MLKVQEAAQEIKLPAKLHRTKRLKTAASTASHSTLLDCIVSLCLCLMPTTATRSRICIVVSFVVALLSLCLLSLRCCCCVSVYLCRCVFCRCVAVVVSLCHSVLLPLILCVVVYLCLCLIPTTGRSLLAPLVLIDRSFCFVSFIVLVYMSLMPEYQFSRSSMYDISFMPICHTAVTLCSHV